MKKNLFLILIIFTFTFKNTYASEITKTDDKRASMYTLEDKIAYKLGDIVLSIKDTDVKFREDDENYFFIVNQNIMGSNMRKNYLNGELRPNVALTSFDSITNMRIDGLKGNKTGDITYMNYKDTKASLGNAVIARLYEESKSVRGENTYQEEKFCSKTFYLSDLFGYQLVTKEGFDETPHKISVKKTFTYDYIDEEINKNYFKYNGLDLNIKYEITINKNEIESYRYLSTYIPELFKTSIDNLKINETFTLYNLCTPSIDLMQYINDHTHDFQIKNIYKDYHELYCEGCDWLKKEDHNFINPYDNIENNECVCKMHKYVNIHIENNIDDELVDLNIDPLSDFPSYNLEKIGYHIEKAIVKELINGELVVKTYDDINNFELPKTIPDTSTKYYLIYSINNYKIRFNKKNNLDLQIDPNLYMEEMVFNYNERQRLNENKYVLKGYDFLGWCDNEELLYDERIDDKDKIKYENEQRLLNITSVNNETINLYPIYKLIKYTVVYHNNINHSVNTKIEYEINKTYNFPDYKSMGVDYKKYSFSGWYLNDNRIKNLNTDSLVQYVVSDGKGNGNDIYVLCKFNDNSSSSSGSDYSSDGPIKQTNNTNNTNDNNTSSNSYQNKDSYINNYTNETKNLFDLINIDKNILSTENTANTESVENNNKTVSDSENNTIKNDEESKDDKSKDEEDNIEKEEDTKEGEDIDDEDDNETENEDENQENASEKNENDEENSYLIDINDNDDKGGFISSVLGERFENILSNVKYFISNVIILGENNMIIMCVGLSLIISLYYIVVFIKSFLNKRKS